MRHGDHSKIYSWEHTSAEAEAIRTQAYTAAKEIITLGKLEAEDILVVGCSSSEVGGASIGSESRPEIARMVFDGIYTACAESGVFLAAQCCEHLNRALILEKAAAKKRCYEPVNVVPVPKAGGSFAAQAYKSFEQPVAVEHIRAEAGLDIGDTLIGMHLKDVAVPVRLSLNSIGEAHLVAARTRAKYIGGARAQYSAEQQPAQQD